MNGPGQRDERDIKKARVPQQQHNHGKEEHERTHPPTKDSMALRETSESSGRNIANEGILDAPAPGQAGNEETKKNCVEVSAPRTRIS